MPAFQTITAFQSLLWVASGALAIMVGWYVPVAWREYRWARTFGDDDDKRISQGILLRNVGTVAGLTAFVVLGVAVLATPSPTVAAAVPERPARIDVGNLAQRDFTPAVTDRSSNTSRSTRKSSHPESEPIVRAQVVPSQQPQASPMSSAGSSPDTSPPPASQPSPASSPDPSPAPSPDPSPDTTPTPSPETSPTPSPGPSTASSSGHAEDRSHGHGKCGDHPTGNGDPKCDEPPKP